MKPLARALLLPLLAVALAAPAAPKAKQEPVTFEDAEAAFMAYDFDRASELLDAYTRKRKKGAPAEEDMVVGPSGATVDRAELLRERITLGSNMLARVEDIEVVDSLTVPAADFFTRYILSPHAGSLRAAGNVPVYVTEDGTRALAESNGAIAETLMLADGTSTGARPLFTRAEIFKDDIAGRVAYPWLMPDGMTLYFAADGPESLGGLDIYIARQADDGSFLQPSNIGMPYNSPANDYMLAIDEETGAGWWATDRNAEPGSDEVTIYVFAPKELRVNLSPDDTPNLAERARLTSIAATGKDGSQAAASIAANLRAITAAPRVAETKAPEFTLELPDGRVLTRSSQIGPVDARSLLPRFKELLRQQADCRQCLDSLRDSYARGNKGAAQKIIAAEIELDEIDNTLAFTRNRLISILCPEN